MKRTLLTGLLVALAVRSPAQTLELPPRSPSAPKGTDFARSIADLPIEEREAKIRAEILSGNVPSFLRKLVPVAVRKDAITATYHVAPDYLAVGPDEDYFLTPLSPSTAQAIADRLECTLPTPRMVDQIYAQAELKLTPEPIPPSPAMTTVPVFLRHNEQVRAQRGDKTLGALVAGHKKDVVIASKLFTTPGKVAIYGWHRRDGKPIQPLYTGHTASWVDYSHGIRLVQRRMTVAGASKTIDDVLADPGLAPLLSADGVMSQTRYPLAECTEELRLDPGVRVVINRPEGHSAKPVLLVFYALPNGNTTEQTAGKTIKPGDDWHFDIQHVAAQTRFLRETVTDRTVVVAYLENELKSWPSWRKKHGDEGIPALLAAVSDRFDEPNTRIVLGGHSGGGSLIFGYLNQVSAIPDRVERIAFLDANYAYGTARHAEKLAAWLKASAAHYLVVLAYNDAVALLDGKPFVSASGGTWGRSRLMLDDLGKSFPFTKTSAGGIDRFAALEGRAVFYLKENPERKILHTVQVERNGFIESLLSGTKLQGAGYSYFGDRAYTRFIRGD
jgi:hypothetical protein